MAFCKYYADNQEGDKSEQLYGLQSGDIVYEFQFCQTFLVLNLKRVDAAIIVPLYFGGAKLRFGSNVNKIKISFCKMGILLFICTSENGGCSSVG